MSRSNQKKAIKKSIKLSMNEDNLVSYFDVKDKLKPFDLIAFRGGDIMSKLITTLETFKLGVGAFSHVGMVVTSDILPIAKIEDKHYELEKDKLYLFESTFTYDIGGLSDGVPDAVTGKGDFGVQLRDLEAVIPRYITSERTRVAWCPLKNNPYNKRDNETDEELEIRRLQLKEKFTEFYKQYENKFYQLDINSLLAAMFPSLRFVRNMRDNIYSSLYSTLYKYKLTKDKEGPAGWQFCSELIANVYKDINIIPSSFDSRDVVPIDFFGCDEDGLPSLVDQPVYFKDWKVEDNKMVQYKVEKKK